jgi:DNA-binding response OmpR family regulator
MNPNPTTKLNPGKEPTRNISSSVSTTEAVKKTILVVDDDEQIRESLCKVLRSEGYEVVLAADGQEGIDKFDPEHIDLLLLDLNLPRKGGWDIFERITSINSLLPIIIITGRENQYDMAAAAGAGALMEKPLDVPFLLQTITELLTEPPETRIERLAGLHNCVWLSLRWDSRSSSTRHLGATFHLKPGNNK